MSVTNWVTHKIVQNRFKPICGAPIGGLNVGFLSLSKDLGVKWIRQIKSYLESPKIVKDFGVFKNVNKWSDEEIIVLSPNNQMARVDHPTVKAVGIGSQVFGLRVHILIWDDIADKENTATKEARKKLWDTFHEGPYRWRRTGGKRIGIGTRMHSKDVYGVKISKSKLTKETPLTKIYKRPYGKTGAIIRVDQAVNFETGDILAPENDEYTIQYFKDELKEMTPGPFNRRYMNKTRDEEDSRYKEEWFEQLYDHDRPYGFIPNGMNVIIGVDPATGVNRKSSKVAFSAIGYNKNEPHKRYLIDYVVERLSPEKQAALFCMWYDTYNATAGIIEKNACQLYLKSFIIEYAKKFEMSPKIIDTYTGSNKWSETFGVDIVSGKFENGAFRLPYADSAKSKTNKLVEMLKDAQNNKPTDIEMSIWFVDQHLKKAYKRNVNRIKLDNPPYLRLIKVGGEKVGGRSEGSNLARRIFV